MNKLSTEYLKLPLEDSNKDFYNLYQQFVNNGADNPVLIPLESREIKEKISGLLTNKGKGTEFLLDIFKNTILKHSVNLYSPMYMGHQVPPALPLASMMDMITSGLNQSLVVSKMSPVLSVIEDELLNFFANKIGYLSDSGGTITSGASASNLLSLLVARNKYFPDLNLDNAIILCSEQSHYSINKAAFIVGIRKQNIVSLPCDDNFAIDITKIQSIVDDLKINNKIPFVICANACSTSVGCFDKLDSIADLACQNNIWFHVDAAHGGALIFSDKLKHLINGIEKADSIAIDGHKMMFMPSSMGICLFKDVNYLKKCFNEENAPYLFNNSNDEYDLGKFSIQCTRRGDVLKLWGAIVTYGTDFFAQRHEHLADMTDYFYNQLKKNTFIEPIHRPQFNIISFRYNPKNCNYTENELNELNTRLRDLVNNTGQLMLTLTVVKNKVCLRATIINPATSLENIDKAINIIEKCAGNYFKL